MIINTYFIQTCHFSEKESFRKFVGQELKYNLEERKKLKVPVALIYTNDACLYWACVSGRKLGKSRGPSQYIIKCMGQVEFEFGSWESVTKLIVTIKCVVIPLYRHHIR